MNQLAILTRGRGAIRACRSVLRAARRLATATGALLLAAPAHASDKLELTPDPMITGILIVVFVLIIFPLNGLIFGPIFNAIDEREKRIDGARRRADQIQGQAEEALARYEDSIRGAREEIMLERRGHLDAARQELISTTSAAKHEAEREIVRAREELQGSLADARSTLRSGAEELAQLAAARILGRSLR